MKTSVPFPFTDAAPRPACIRGRVITDDLFRAIVRTKDTGLSVVVPVNGNRAKVQETLRKRLLYHGFKITTRSVNGHLHVWVREETR